MFYPFIIIYDHSLNYKNNLYRHTVALSCLFYIIRFSLTYCSDKEKILGGFQRLPSIGSGKKRGTPGSAKEHYLQKARYYPGAPNAPIKPNIEGRVVDAGSGRKFVEFTSGNVQQGNNSRYMGDINQGTKLPGIKKKESTDRLAGIFLLPFSILFI